jgi:hypothetical protein
LRLVNGMLDSRTRAAVRRRAQDMANAKADASFLLCTESVHSLQMQNTDLLAEPKRVQTLTSYLFRALHHLGQVIVHAEKAPGEGVGLP